jgi:hypothetical protein
MIYFLCFRNIIPQFQPPGVYCHGVPKVQELPFELPSVFEVQAEFKVFGGEVGQLPTIDSFQVFLIPKAHNNLDCQIFSLPTMRVQNYWLSSSTFRKLAAGTIHFMALKRDFSGIREWYTTSTMVFYFFLDG